MFIFFPDAEKRLFQITVIIVVYLFYTVCWFISQFIHFDSPIIFILLKSKRYCLKEANEIYYHKSTLKNDFSEQVILSTQSIRPADRIRQK